MSQASPVLLAGQPAADSHAMALDRFGRSDVAATYPAEYSKNRRHQRERNCILRALQYVPAGCSILDLPCGTGRLTTTLVAQGFRVTAADASAAMLKHAKENYAKWQAADRAQRPNVEFRAADVMNTGFSAGQFDAVFCNRLFHHFTESETRQRALTELRRICRKTLVVSFFNSFALDAVKFRMKHRLRGTVPDDRIPIPFRAFQRDLASAGLKIRAKLATRWGISPLWYIVAEPN